MNQILEQSLNFDPLRIPPIRDIALIHQRATRCGYLVESNECCQCCGLEANTQLISLKDNIINLAFLGQGIPLFFNLTFLIILLIFLLVLIFGIPMIVLNYIAQNCLEPQNTAYITFITKGCLQNCPLDNDDYFLIQNLIQSDDCNIICDHYDDLCVNSIIAQTSFYNKQNEENLKLIQTIFVLGIVFIIKIYLVIIRERQRRIEQICDSELISPSDFTAMLTGLPEKEYNEKELAHAIEQYCQKFDSQVKYEVIKINIAYDIKTFIIKSREKVRLEKIIQNNSQTNQRNTKNIKAKFQLEKIQQTINDLKKEINAIEEQIESGSYRKTTSVAFITFQTKQQLQNLISQTKLSYWEQFLSQVKKMIKKDKRRFYFKDKLINICRAPEPDDIFWENCGIENLIKIKRKFISWIVTVILLGVSFATLFGLEYIQSKYLSSNLDFVMKMSLSISKSIIITIVDALIYYFITLLANHERHVTKTHQDSSVAQKLCCVQFINSCFLLIVIHIIGPGRDGDYTAKSKFSIQKQGGISYDLLFVCGMNALVTPITAFFNPIYLIKRIKQKYIESNKKMNQLQANKLFEGPQIVLYDQYSFLCKTAWMTLFLAPLIPVSIIINFIGLFIYYWIQKYLLLRRYSKPPFQSSHLDKEMLSILDLSPILLIGMQYWIDSIYFSNNINKFLNIGTMVLASLELILPSYRIHQFIFKANTDDIENQRYVDVHLKFPTDYDRTNPLTQEQATQEFLRQKFSLMSRATITSSRYSKRKSTRQALQDYVFRGIIDVKKQRIQQLKKKLQTAYKLKLFNQINSKISSNDLEKQDDETISKQADTLYQLTPNYNFSKIINKFPNNSQYYSDLTSRSNSISSTIQLNTSKYQLTTIRNSQITSKRLR